jgi:hypothetical protein
MLVIGPNTAFGPLDALLDFSDGQHSVGQRHQQPIAWTGTWRAGLLVPMML